MSVYISSKRKKRLLENQKEKEREEGNGVNSLTSEKKIMLPSPPPSSPLESLSPSDLNSKPMKKRITQKNTITSMFSAKLKNQHHQLLDTPTRPDIINKAKTTTSKDAISDNSKKLHKNTILPSLVQSQLLVGAESQKTCPLCGMSYSPIIKADLRSHDNFHNRSLQGRQWSDSYGTKIVQFTSNEYIAKVDPLSKLSSKSAVQDILNIVNTELNAPPENPTWRTTSGQGAAFVYVKDNRATSLLVVERISTAYRMDCGSGQLSESPIPAVMGVSRIFTARNYRGSNMATRLLDASLSNFVYGLCIPKTAVAWSQPTASGLKLSLKWGEFDPTKKSTLVYIESS